MWSPDGRLAFLLEHDGNQEIYVWDGARAALLWAAPPGEIVRALAWWTPAP